jgi:hypothetical protein
VTKEIADMHHRNSCDLFAVADLHCHFGFLLGVVSSVALNGSLDFDHVFS